MKERPYHGDLALLIFGSMALGVYGSLKLFGIFIGWD